MEGSGGSTPMGTPMATPPTTLPGAPARRGSGGASAYAWCGAAAGGSCAKSAGTPGTPATPAGAARPGGSPGGRPGGRAPSAAAAAGGGASGAGASAASSTCVKRERRFCAPDTRRKCFWACDATCVGVRVGT